MRAGGISFVVPHKLPARDGAWEFRGYRFVYKGEVERTILGERLALHLIEFPGDYGTLWFLYSEDRGFAGIRDQTRRTVQHLREHLGVRIRVK